MMIRFMKLSTLFSIATCATALVATLSQANDLLVVDRTLGSVYRYSADGDFLNIVVKDTANLQGPAGIVLSPDQKKLYISNTQSSTVFQYDYNLATGMATNPTLFADSTAGLAFPNGLKFSQDGTKLYVANLGGTGVAQLSSADGSPAGFPLFGPQSGGAGYSGLDFAPSGRLIAGVYSDFTTFQGSADIANSTGSALENLVSPSFDLALTAGVMVHGNDLYLSTNASSSPSPPVGAGGVYRFNATTGAADPTFSSVTGLAYPQGMVPALDGNGFLLGILGESDGAGRIDRYAFDGTFLGLFAASGDGTSAFKEATAFAVVAIPEPMSGGLIGIALISLSCVRSRRVS
jgi:DNA-binding beta-propeller fold protein YncE